MASVPSSNPNINYNYQKNPYVVNSNYAQSELAKTIVFRDRPNTNRNITFLFPANMSTPNPGAGAPTLLAQTKTTIDGTTPYVGRQVY